MTAIEILTRWANAGLPAGAVMGFVVGSGLTLFGWMIGQVWGIFRKIASA